MLCAEISNRYLKVLNRRVAYPPDGRLVDWEYVWIFFTNSSL